jgi:hypothetical protein
MSVAVVKDIIKDAITLKEEEARTNVAIIEQVSGDGF